jgi:hypothetical protein
MMRATRGMRYISDGQVHSMQALTPAGLRLPDGAW